MATIRGRDALAQGAIAIVSVVASIALLTACGPSTVAVESGQEAPKTQPEMPVPTQEVCGYETLPPNARSLAERAVGVVVGRLVRIEPAVVRSEPADEDPERSTTTLDGLVFEIVSSFKGAETGSLTVLSPAALLSADGSKISYLSPCVRSAITSESIGQEFLLFYSPASSEGMFTLTSSYGVMHVAAGTVDRAGGTAPLSEDVRLAHPLHVLEGLSLSEVREAIG